MTCDNTGKKFDIEKLAKCNRLFSIVRSSQKSLLKSRSSVTPRESRVHGELELLVIFSF